MATTVGQDIFRPTKFGGKYTVTLIPGDGIGAEVSESVKEIFKADNVPVEWEQVDVLDVTNGARLTTYAITAPAGSGVIGINGAAAQVNQLLVDSKAGIRDFSNTGLAEISQTIRELRKLTDSLNVIATKLERDPAGFVFSGKQGYAPK